MSVFIKPKGRNLVLHRQRKLRTHCNHQHKELSFSKSLLQVLTNPNKAERTENQLTRGGNARASCYDAIISLCNPAWHIADKTLSATKSTGVWQGRNFQVCVNLTFFQDPYLYLMNVLIGNHDLIHDFLFAVLRFMAISVTLNVVLYTIHIKMYSFVKCCQIVGFVKPLIELLWTPMYNLLYILCSTCKRRLSTSIFHSVPRQSVHIVQYGMRISSNVLTSPLCWQTSLYC